MFDVDKKVKALLVLVIASIGFTIGTAIYFRNTPVEEIPWWVWWLFWARQNHEQEKKEK